MASKDDDKGKAKGKGKAKKDDKFGWGAGDIVVEKKGKPAQPKKK